MSITKLTPKSKKQILYTDFFKDLSIHPISNDIGLRVNEESVKEALKNLLLTRKGERLFQPEIGCGIRDLIFDNMTPVTLKIVEEQVKEVINNYEPRITLIDVTVEGLIDDNRVMITLSFYIRNSQQPVTTTIFLERTR